MKDWLDTGLARFGEAMFQTIKYQLDQVELHCSFLVFGMDESNRAHVFTVEDPGVVCNHDLYGVWAIGSGSNRALSSLFFQEYRQSLPEASALYYIAEAKFMAEGGAVGEDTLVMIKRFDGSGMGSLSMDVLKSLWKKKGRPRMPKNIQSTIDLQLKGFFKLSDPTSS
jgi:20S proteasome alpha/beta subunit